MTDEHEQHDIETKKAILENIEKFGSHLALHEPDNYLPGFAYTIGLYQKFKHPEIICFGLNNDVMGAMLNHACELIKQGISFEPNKQYEGFLKDYKIQFLKVEKDFYADYVGYAGWFYDYSFDFPLLQIVWTDKHHKFPWEEDFKPEWKFKQPLLDRNSDFKFYEERNLGVYTTKQAFEGDPILFVYHDEDGDWQFHTSSSPNSEDAMLVCLEEITKLDPSINEIFHLQYGWRAWRECPNSEWEYEENTDEDVDGK
jgi:hypothetical protein